MLLKEYSKDNLVCKIYSDRDSMGKSASKIIAEKMRQLLNEKAEINMLFAAAPSQNDVLKYLIQEDIDWSRVVGFHIDEYVGLGNRKEKSFEHYLNQAIFSKVKMKEVYFIGYDGDVKTICENYEQLLKTHPIDIVCLGIGENGHIAFNDPDVADFQDKQMIKLVPLDEKCRNQQVNDKTFDSIDEVPKYAVTLTIPLLISAQSMFCVVPTHNKASAVYRTMTDPISAKLPATILRRHPNAILFTDSDSAKLLLEQNG